MRTCGDDSCIQLRQLTLSKNLWKATGTMDDHFNQRVLVVARDQRSSRCLHRQPVSTKEFRWHNRSVTEIQAPECDFIPISPFLAVAVAAMKIE